MVDKKKSKKIQPSDIRFGDMAPGLLQAEMSPEGGIDARRTENTSAMSAAVRKVITPDIARDQKKWPAVVCRSRRRNAPHALNALQQMRGAYQIAEDQDDLEYWEYDVMSVERYAANPVPDDLSTKKGPHQGIMNGFCKTAFPAPGLNFGELPAGVPVMMSLQGPAGNIWVIEEIDDEQYPFQGAEIKSGWGPHKKRQRLSGKNPGPGRPATQGFAYPGSIWYPANNWRSPRPGAITHVVVHTTEGSLKGSLTVLTKTRQSRSSGKWRRPSAHYVVAPNGDIYNLVPDADVAWAAGHRGYNDKGIQIEIVGQAGDPNSWGEGTKRACARLFWWLHKTYKIPFDYIGPRKKWPHGGRSPTGQGGGSISSQQRGFIAHGAITPKRRTDPGEFFPWDKIVSMAKAGGNKRYVAGLKQKFKKGTGSSNKPKGPPPKPNEAADSDNAKLAAAMAAGTGPPS